MKPLSWTALLTVAGVMTGAIMTIALRGGARAPAVPPPPVSTATIERTNLATTVLASGTLGYSPARPVINQLAGTYTELPPAGRTIRAGQVLYRVDDQPVALMTGRTPAWRPFGLGMTPGPDVRELQASLAALGYAPFTTPSTAPSGSYDLATAYAVERWQAAIGDPVTGQIALGQLVFLPGPTRVGPPRFAPGEAAVPGQLPFGVTTSTRTVSVPVTPSTPPVHAGEPVSIILPTLARTPGVVTAASPAILTISPRRPAVTGSAAGVPVQVSLTIESVRHVLAVPVPALLALAGGGYGLEIVRPDGVHQLTGVTTGIFAGGLVQVEGTGLTPGLKVVVAQ